MKNWLDVPCSPTGLVSQGDNELPSQNYSFYFNLPSSGLWEETYKGRKSPNALSTSG